MTNGRLDPHIENFIASCINSVEQLEILLLLRQKSELDVETINRELRTSPTSVEKRLSDLIRKHLITFREADGRVIYRYEPIETHIAVIDDLAVLYGTHRVAIINAIFPKPADKLKDFSEAFRLRDKGK